MRGFALGSMTLILFALSSGCTSDETGCGPQSCTNGCCSPQGICQPFSVMSCGTTGLAGQPCLACSQGQVCNGGRCQLATCSPSTCPNGCCDANTQQCVVAISNARCGAGGVTCMQCGNGETCQGGRCSAAVCGPANCSGCCNAAGQCVAQTSQTACGFGGGTCQACLSNQICTGGQCRVSTGNCDSSNCSGCCDSRGTCVQTPNAGACGSGGQACVACSGGQACTNGQCTCSPQSCPGCCQGDTCQPGQQPAACGIGGASCTACPMDAGCDNGRCIQGCTAATCATGCCTGNVCNLGGQTDTFSCGTAANPCRKCLQHDVCDRGTCNDQARCNSTNCPPANASGPHCCIDGNCVPGTSSQVCGVSGQHCSQCGAGEYCLNGLCDVSPFSRWRVEIVGVSVEPSWLWDITNAPDMYVEMTVGTISKRTARVGNNSYSVIFNEIVGTVRGEDLTQRSIQWKLMDKDSNDDDTMFECIITLTGDELRRKDVYIYDKLSDLPPQRTGQEGLVPAAIRCQGGTIIWGDFGYIQFRFTQVS